MRTDEQYDPVEMMTNRLLAWLDDPHAKLDVLADWLQGYGLPGAERDEHTFLWIIRAIPPGSERHAIRRKLAERVRLLLDAKPDVNPVGSQPERFLTNLFLLCGSLRVRESLAGPIYKIFERLQEGKNTPKYFSPVVLDALRDALAANQIDKRLLPVWQTLLTGDKHPLLPGNQLDGWQGILIMQHPSDSLHPRINDIGQALATLAMHVNTLPNENADFLDAVDTFCTRFGRGRFLNQALIEQADANNWPHWAIRKLPGHFLVVEEDEREVIAYSSDQLFPVIVLLSYEEISYSQKVEIKTDFLFNLERHLDSRNPKDKRVSNLYKDILYERIDVLCTMCSGAIYKIKVSKYVANRMQVISPQIEESIRTNPYRGERASWGVYADTLEVILLDSRAAGDSLLEKTISKVQPFVRNHMLGFT